MANFKLLTETDLRIQFKLDTNNYPTYDSKHDIESTTTDSNYQTIQYLKSLEKQLLEYKNADLVIEQANIEAETVVKTEAEKVCGGCKECTCNE